MSGNQVWGFVGLAPRLVSRVWKDDSLTIIRNIGEILLNTIEQRESAEVLQESEERWRSIVSSAFDFTAVIELDGTIRQFTRRATPDGQRHDFVGDSAFDLLDNNYRKELRSRVKRVLAGEPSSEMEFRSSLSGLPTWYRGRLGPFRERGELVGVTLSATSLQKQKDVEDQLRSLRLALEKAARVSVVGHISTQIAHQLGQPLQVIASWVSGCQNLLANGNLDPGRLEEALANIKEATDAASDTIDGIRKFVAARQAGHEPNNSQQHRG